MQESENLIKILTQLDEVRFALRKNLDAYDDELEETYNDFLIELEELEELIKKVKK